MESDVHPGVSGPSTHHTSFLPCFVQGKRTWGAALEGDGCVEIASQRLPWAAAQPRVGWWEERGRSSSLCLGGGGRGDVCGF